MTPCVRFKSGVTLTPAPAGVRILAALDALARTLGRDILVTSGSDSHPAGDPHARGEAYDIAVPGVTAADISAGLAALRAFLGVAFTVLYEVPQMPKDALLASLAYVNPKATGPHIHIQPVKGTSWPS